MANAENLFNRHMKQFEQIQGMNSQSVNIVALIYSACIVVEAISNAKDEILQGLKNIE